MLISLAALLIAQGSDWSLEVSRVYDERLRTSPTTITNVLVTPTNNTERTAANVWVSCTLVAADGSALATSRTVVENLGPGQRGTERVEFWDAPSYHRVECRITRARYD